MEVYSNGADLVAPVCLRLSPGSPSTFPAPLRRSGCPAQSPESCCLPRSSPPPPATPPGPAPAPPNSHSPARSGSPPGFARCARQARTRRPAAAAPALFPPAPSPDSLPASSPAANRGCPATASPASPKCRDCAIPAPARLASGCACRAPASGSDLAGSSCSYAYAREHHAGMGQCLGHARRPGASGNLARFHSFLRIQQLRHLRRKLGCEPPHLVRRPVCRLLVSLDALQHETPDNLVRLVKRRSRARQGFGQVRRHHPALRRRRRRPRPVQLD